MAYPKLPPLVIPWLGDTSGFQKSTAVVKSLVNSMTSAFSRGMTNNLTDVEKQAHRTNKSFKQLEKTVRGMGKHTANFGRGMRSGGFQASYLMTAPIIGMMKKGAGEIIEYEANLTTLAAKFGVVPKATETAAQAMGGYSKFLQSQAANSVQSITDLSDAAIGLGRGGVKQERSKWMLEPIRMLSTIERQKASKTTEQVKAMANILDIKQTKAGYAEFADMIAYTTTNTAFDMKGLTAGVVKAGGTARSYGQSPREALSTLGLFADLGVKGGSTGVAAQNFMTYLLSSTKESASLKKKLGIGRKDLEQEDGTAKPVHEVMKTIIESFQKNGATDMTKLGTLLSIFKRRSLGPIAAALNTMTNEEGKETINRSFNRFLKREEEINGKSSMETNQKGLAARQEKLMEGTTWAKQQRLTSAMTNMYIAFGSSGALESMTNLIISLTSAVTAVSEWDPKTLSSITYLALGLAVIGPAMIVASSMVSLLSVGITGLSMALAVANFVAINGFLPTLGLYVGMMLELAFITPIASTGLSMLLVPLVAITGLVVGFVGGLWAINKAFTWMQDKVDPSGFIGNFVNDWLRGFDILRNGTFSIADIFKGWVITMKEYMFQIIKNTTWGMVDLNADDFDKNKKYKTDASKVTEAKQRTLGDIAMDNVKNMKSAIGISISNNNGSDVTVDGTGLFKGDDLVTTVANGAFIQGGKE